jgi:hypothetical protein
VKAQNRQAGKLAFVLAAMFVCANLAIATLVGL